MLCMPAAPARLPVLVLATVPPITATTATAAQDHIGEWDPPALAFAFHTSFVDCGVVRATAKRLDTPSGAGKGKWAGSGLWNALGGRRALPGGVGPRLAEWDSRGEPSWGMGLHSLSTQGLLPAPCCCTGAVAQADAEGFFMDIILDSELTPDAKCACMKLFGREGAAQPVALSSPAAECCKRTPFELCCPPPLNAAAGCR